MSRRPRGVTLLAVGLGVLGAAAVVGGLAFLGLVAGSTIDPTTPAAVAWFLRLFPFVLVAWGALDLAAAIGLWTTARWGRTAGLLALGAWLLEEVLAIGAGLTGWPAGADRSLDPVLPVVRMAVVGGLAYYLWQYDPADGAEPADEGTSSGR